jgi:hypothetical protein
LILTDHQAAGTNSQRGDIAVPKPDPSIDLAGHEGE